MGAKFRATHMLKASVILIWDIPSSTKMLKNWLQVKDHSNGPTEDEPSTITLFNEFSAQLIANITSNLECI